MLLAAGVVRNGYVNALQAALRLSDHHRTGSARQSGKLGGEIYILPGNELVVRAIAQALDLGLGGPVGDFGVLTLPLDIGDAKVQAGDAQHHEAQENNRDGQFYNRESAAVAHLLMLILQDSSITTGGQLAK